MRLVAKGWCRIPATGNGKARRFSRATAEALIARREAGASITTVNRYVQAAKMFTKWMHAEKRTADNPLADLKRVGNPEHDRRREFATLTADEIGRLIVAARDSAADFMGLSGRDRAALYLCAVSTAFRPVELSRLTPADFLLTDPALLVRLDGNRTKNGKAAEQPVSPVVAAVVAAGRRLLGPPLGRVDRPEERGPSPLSVRAGTAKSSGLSREPSTNTGSCSIPSRAANCPGRVYSGASSLCGSVIADGRFGSGGRLRATTEAIDGQSVAYGVRALSNWWNVRSGAWPVRL